MSRCLVFTPGATALVPSGVKSSLRYRSPQEQKAIVVTDKRNSRSYYHTQNGTGHLIASRVDYLGAKLNQKQQPSENDLIEEGYELILAALKWSLNQFTNPILFLSGGTDSRVLLGCLQGLKSDVPAITWGTQPIKEADDTDISVKLAQFAKVPHRFYEIKNDDYLDHIHHTELLPQRY